MELAAQILSMNRAAAVAARQQLATMVLLARAARVARVAHHQLVDHLLPIRAVAAEVEHQRVAQEALEAAEPEVLITAAQQPQIPAAVVVAEMRGLAQKPLHGLAARAVRVS